MSSAGIPPRRPLPVFAQRAALAALLIVALLIAGCGGSQHEKTQSSPSGRSPSSGGEGVSGNQPFRFFSPDSFWNRPLSADAQVDSRSSQMVSWLLAEVHQEQQHKSGPWINTTHDGIPIVTVPANQPTVPVKLEAVDGYASPTLKAAWSRVPLPHGAQPSDGDRNLVVWQPSTDRMWEFFDMRPSGTGWMARWGGAMRSVSSNPGVYSAAAWPGAQPNWGVTASSMPLVGGAITIQQLRTGNIKHALALAIPHPRAGEFAVPAERTDGSSSNPRALPEGARLRLDPTLNLSTLHLPPVGLAIARAAQRYGIIVRDTSGIVAFAGQAPVTTGIQPTGEPYTGAGGLFRGQMPSEILARFPWDHLQVMKLALRKGS